MTFRSLLPAALALLMLPRLAAQSLSEGGEDGSVKTQAQSLVSQNKAEEAVEVYTKALEADPRNAELLLGRAQIYRYNLQLPELAAADYDRAVQVAPTSEEALLSRANSHDDDKHNAEVLRDLDAIIRLNPASLTGYRTRAMFHFVRKE